jgi:hypothetical protein
VNLNQKSTVDLYRATSIMASRISETDDQIFIDHIPTMRFGEQMDNTFVKSMQLSLNALGESLTYDYLMGISGAAFRLHFEPGWCPSSVDATVGFDVSREICISLGYTMEFVRINHNSFSDIRSLYKKIKTQINIGRPIVAINLKGNMDWGIVTGYLKNEPGILCRTFYDEMNEYSLASRAPWLNFFIGEKKNGMTRKEMFVNSLKTAVKLANTKKFEEYYSGFAAYEIWIRRLKNSVESFNQKDLAQIIKIHFIILNALLDGRRSAVNYLSSSDAADQLANGQQIIDNYSRIVDLLESSTMNLAGDENLDPAEQKFQFFNRQSDILSQAYEFEKKGIKLIEQEV